MPLVELTAHQDGVEPVAFFVPQGWAALVSLLLVTLVEGIKAQVTHLTNAKPLALLEKELELAELKQRAKGINPKQEFVAWAVATRRIGVVTKQVEAMSKDIVPNPTAAALGRWLRFKAVLYAALVFLWFSTPILQIPSGWFWPLSYPLALPRHSVGTVGIVAWVAGCQVVATGVGAAVSWLLKWRQRVWVAGVKAQREAAAAAATTPAEAQSPAASGNGAAQQAS